MPYRSRGEMDIMTAFEAVVPGSNPGGSTATERPNYFGLDRIRKGFRCRLREAEKHPRR